MNSYDEYILALKSMRTSCGLTQKQLSVKVGVSSQTISNIECGLHCPSGAHLHKMLVALNADMPTVRDFREKFKTFRSDFYNRNKKQ